MPCFAACEYVFLAKTAVRGYIRPVLGLTKQEFRVILTIVGLLATGMLAKSYRAMHPATPKPNRVTVPGMSQPAKP